MWSILSCTIFFPLCQCLLFQKCRLLSLRLRMTKMTYSFAQMWMPIIWFRSGHPQSVGYYFAFILMVLVLKMTQTYETSNQMQSSKFQKKGNLFVNEWEWMKTHKVFTVCPWCSRKNDFYFIADVSCFIKIPKLRDKNGNNHH